MRARETVLVTAGGTVVAQGIIKSLRLASSSSPLSPRYRVVVSDMSPQAAGLYRGDLGVVVPPASSANYIDAILDVSRRENISAVFCGSDEELPVLAEAADRIRRKVGSTVISNSREAITLGQDKWRTYGFLSKKGIPCADSSLPRGWETFTETHSFPVVVKPRRGHGSLGFQLVSSRSEVGPAIERLERAGYAPMLQEHLPDGESEFTTGVSSDPRGRVIASISMRRKLKAGQTAKAFVEDFPTVRKAAERVARAMRSKGPLNVQARVERGVPKVFEVNPRFSASTPIRAVAGVNEPDLLFRSWVLGETLTRPNTKEIVALRYLNEVYVRREDYEETSRTGRSRGVRSFIPDYF